MANINETLKKIGLTNTESEIYLTGLSYEKIGVGELLKETGINRTTIYHALETLTQKGLVAKKGTGSRLVFIMTKPHHIERLLESKIAEIESQKHILREIVPLLESRRVGAHAKVSVSHHEGIEGIKIVVEEALYCKDRRWDIIAPVENFFSEFDKTYARYFIETRKRKGIISRSLWETAGKGRPLSEIEKKERNPRLLPKVMRGKFKSVIIVFDDKVAIISSLKELSAILIQSTEIRDTMEALFDGLWTTSEEI